LRFFFGGGMGRMPGCRMSALSGAGVGPGGML
jgi:hypothetical protein